MTTPNQPQYAPAPAPKPASALSIKLADLIVGVGALIILLFSFGPVVSYPIGGYNLPGRSLWSWLSPLGLFVILAALLLLGTAIADVWWKRDKQLAGVHRHHVQVGLALYVLFTVIGLCFASIGGVSIGIGWGGIFEILGALVVTAGALLNHFEQLQNPIAMPNVSVKPSSSTTSYPPAQQGYAPPAPQQGYAPPAPQQGYAPPTAPVDYSSQQPTTQIDPQTPPNV
jgi:hypothetical protein